MCGDTQCLNFQFWPMVSAYQGLTHIYNQNGLEPLVSPLVNGAFGEATPGCLPAYRGLTGAYHMVSLYSGDTKTHLSFKTLKFQCRSGGRGQS